MRMERKIWAAVLLSLAGVQLLSGCGKRQTDSVDKLQIGVACYDQSDTFISELVESFQEQLSAYAGDQLKTTVTVRDAVGYQRTQNDQVEEMLTSGCNVLCVNLVDRTAPSDIIDLAREHDVPIIFFNKEPVEEDVMRWNKLYYVGADAEQSGVMQGELAADAIEADSRTDRNKDGTIQYVILEGEAGHQDAIIRTEKVVDTLKNAGIRLEKLGHGVANWNRAQAQNRMSQMIGQYQNQVELVLANNDDMVLGAIDAYEKMNITESTLPVFFGIDGTRAGLQAIADGKLAGTVYNDKEGQAGAMVKLAVALVTGEGMDEIEFEKERSIYLSYSKITGENVRAYMEEAETEESS